MLVITSRISQYVAAEKRQGEVGFRACSGERTRI